MGSCCCCCASRNSEPSRSPPFLRHRVPDEREPLSSTVSAFSTTLLVDTSLDTTASLDTYRPPPLPVPYESYVARPLTPSENRESPRNDGEVALQATNAELVPDTNSITLEQTKTEVDRTASKEFDDEYSDEVKKSSKPVLVELQDEEDVCPTCFEEYDADNPKIITKCGHHFHLGCILEWMERSDTCPFCYQEMAFSPAKEA